jgi:hypothetical protein
LEHQSGVPLFNQRVHQIEQFGVEAELVGAWSEVSGEVIFWEGELMETSFRQQLPL